MSVHHHLPSINFKKEVILKRLAIKKNCDKTFLMNIMRNFKRKFSKMMMLRQSLTSSSQTSLCMPYKWMENSTSLKRKVTYLICYKLNKEFHTDGVTLCLESGP